jgi:hypothetical protein
MNKKDGNIENEELMKMAPTLFEMDRTNNLQAPKGYFENLSDSVISKTESKDQLEVPNDYFNTLPDKVMAKIEQAETNILSIRKRNYTRIVSIAASIAAIFIIGFLLNKNSIENPIITDNVYLADLTSTELKEAMDYIEMEELICYVDFGEDFNEEIQFDNSINDIDLDFTSDEIDEYLSSDYYLDVEF